MTMTFAQLTRAVTVEQALELCLSTLTRLRFNARSWQSGSVPRTLVELFARVYSAQSAVVSEIAAAGFNDTATGDWLDLLSESHYQTRRKPGVRTQGYVALTAEAMAPGPFTIEPYTMVFADRVRGRTYRNIEALTLEAGTTAELLVEAEAVGADGDVPPNTITVAQTPLAGVTVNNPARTGSLTWITQNGGDLEADETLRERNRKKWATRSASTLPGYGFESYALEAHASVRRAYADAQNPRGPGTIDVYLAGDAGDVAPAVVQAVTEYLTGSVDQIPKVPLGADLLVKSAVSTTVALRGQVYILAPYNNRATQQAIVDQLKAYFRAMPIGGTRMTTGGAGRVPFGDLYRVLLSTPGVRNVVFTHPTGDYELPPSAVAVPLTQLSYVSV